MRFLVERGREERQAKLSITSVFRWTCLICFVLYPSHILASYLFIGSPLQPWRQMLSITMVSISVVYLTNSKKISRELFLIFLMLTATFLLALYSAWQGYSLMRIAYAALSIIGVSGALMIESITTRLPENQHPWRRLYGPMLLYLSLGLIFDYFTDAFQGLPRAEASNDLENLGLGSLRRASFLFGASTLVYPFLSFCFIGFLVSSASLNRAKVIVYWLLTSIAMGVTLSRAGILCWFALSALMVLSLQGRLFTGRMFIILGFAIVVFDILIESVASLIFLQPDLVLERFSNPLAETDSSNSARFNLWLDGLKLFQARPELFVGFGLGSTMSQIPDGMPVASHYESSLFQSMHEGGLVGLFIRYCPAGYAAVQLLKHPSALKSLKIRLYASWLVLFLIITTAAPTAGAYHNQLAYFYVCGLLISRAKR